MRFITFTVLLALSVLCVAGDNVVPNKLVQLIIDSKELSPYWHPEVKGRVPLKVLHQHLATSEGIKKHGKSVVLVKESGDFAYFEISKFSIINGEWHVSIAYPIEGVTGSFTAQMLPNRQWKLLSASVVEH